MVHSAAKVFILLEEQTKSVTSINLFKLLMALLVLCGSAHLDEHRAGLGGDG